MGSARPGALRRLTERLTRSSDELNSDDLKRESSNLGVVLIGVAIVQSGATRLALRVTHSVAPESLLRTPRATIWRGCSGRLW